MQKIGLSEQRRRLEKCRQRFEKSRSEADVLKGRQQSALEQLKEFGVTSTKEAKTLLLREGRKEERTLADITGLLDELEEEVGIWMM